jgi:hypothetical protein
MILVSQGGSQEKALNLQPNTRISDSSWTKETKPFALNNHHPFIALPKEAMS